MPDDPARAALDALPRVRASQGFTSRVMQRIGAEQNPSHPATLRWIAAAVLGVTLLGTGALYTLRRVDEGQRLQSLRAEHQAIRSELSEIERMAPAEEPVIYLGSDSRSDYVLDLRRNRGPAIPDRAGAMVVPANRVQEDYQ